MAENESIETMFAAKTVQASEMCPSIDSRSRGLKRSIHRNQQRVDQIMAELKVSPDTDALALLDIGLERSVSGRVERLLSIHPKFERRFIETIQACNVVLDDERRHTTQEVAA